jgi:hypothetical protein
LSLDGDHVRVTFHGFFADFVARRVPGGDGADVSTIGVVAEAVFDGVLSFCAASTAVTV